VQSPYCLSTGRRPAAISDISPDPLGNGVPVADREREAAMQDARRD
jgi:hypothetical protein